MLKVKTTQAIASSFNQLINITSNNEHTEQSAVVIRCDVPRQLQQPTRHSTVEEGHLPANSHVHHMPGDTALCHELFVLLLLLSARPPMRDTAAQNNYYSDNRGICYQKGPLGLLKFYGY